MKKFIILSVLLCISCLTGCQKIESEIGMTNQEEKTLEEKIEEAGKKDEIENTSSQEISTNESESKEYIEWDEKDTSFDESDSIEKINKYMIPEQSFDITLDDWGEVQFVSCRPSSCDFEASFFLIRDEQILYKFPYLCEDNKKNYTGCFDSIGAVSFRDINDDGKEDIIIIFNYFSGSGPTGMVPRPGIRIFLAGENEFYFAEDIMTDVAQHILGKDMTIENIYNYLQNKKLV